MRRVRVAGQGIAWWNFWDVKLTGDCESQDPSGYQETFAVKTCLLLPK